MATKNVLDETKKVLELMEESEEKVFLLQQDLKKNENLYVEIKQELNTLRELTNINSADLEDNKNLKSNIKEHNIKVLNFAQQIYTCGQELYNEINLRESESENIEKVFNKNESKYLEKLNEYSIQEEKLKADLEFIKNEENKKHQQKDLESQFINKENEELKDELTKINEELQKYACYVNECMELDQQELAYKEEITKIQEYLKVTENEINAVAQLLNELEGYKEKFENEAKHYISELDNKIKYLSSKTEVALKVLDKNKIQHDQLLEEINKYEIDKKEKECEKYKNYLKEIELSMKETEESAKQEIAMFEKSNLKCGDIFKYQKELNYKLKMDISSFEVKTKKLDEEIKRISKDIASSEAKMSNTDLKQELNSKQEELSQLKGTRRSLKEKYNKKLLDTQTETKKLQNEIEDIELKNKNLQEEIENIKLEIIQLKDSKEAKTNEERQEEEKAKELEIQIRHLTFELVKTKSETSSKRKTSEVKVMKPPKRMPQPSCSSKKLKIHRHWDSDSSIEGEDRRFSELAKQKVRMKKFQGHLKVPKS